MNRLLMGILLASLLSGCASMGSATAPAETLRKPASTCEILMPFLVRTKGRLGTDRMMDNKEFTDKFAARGYTAVVPAFNHDDADTSNDFNLGNYFDQIPEGGYGVLINAGISLTQNGWGEILLLKKSGGAFQMTPIRSTGGGWDNHLIEAMSGLPQCSVQ